MHIMAAVWSFYFSHCTYVRTYVSTWCTMCVRTCVHPCTVDQFWRNSLMYWFTSSGQSCCTQWLLLGMHLHKRHTKDTQKMSHAAACAHSIQYCTYSKLMHNYIRRSQCRFHTNNIFIWYTITDVYMYYIMHMYSLIHKSIYNYTIKYETITTM